ncbi:transmembrane protein 248 [Tachysurus vachellii]|uniref:transmembrane protein 248 n=1 Tax=Tachysurus vachellii TaxID=175792 RepID=UPI00296B02F2|nr:transmembrane protein 248 [Tachysurus vachellii]XP_060743085.1 transmembrane protein 248 [Tachysurus vachellii]XP_060743086.1 transmembrane protein 248 [Tachysurus vachellii]
MARWQPVTNLRSRIIHHPPVTVFFMCLVVLAGAFISIGIYSQNHDMKNPDIVMDWNQMLASLAKLKFCSQLNDSDLLNEKPDINSPPLLTHADELINSTQQKHEVISKLLLVPLMHVGDHLDHSSISATLLGSQLGLRESAGKQLLNITLFLDIQTHSSTTDSALIQKLSNMQTRPRAYESCLMITAPSHILPQTPSPPRCPSDKIQENNISPVSTHAVQSITKSSNTPSCLSLEFTPDPKLTVLLTQDEKILARYHLLLVSIALVSLCITMCLLGTLTFSKPGRHLSHDPQKETLLG